MPNQDNFRSDVTTKTEPKFFASRIVKIPEEGILLEELPGGFGYRETDNVEIHFYDYRTNVLIQSVLVRVTDEDILKLHIVSYNDGTYTTYLRIDFTKLFETKGIILLPNTYRMVLNFFSDEIGSYENKNLYIQEISPSRTEIQLGFVDTNYAENENSLYEFVLKSFSKTYAVGVVEKIFQSGVRLNDPVEGITYTNVVNNINVPEINQTYQNTIQEVINLKMEPTLKDTVDRFIPTLYQSIADEIIIRDDFRIQEEELKDIIQKKVAEQIRVLQNTLGPRIRIT